MGQHNTPSISSCSSPSVSNFRTLCKSLPTPGLNWPLSWSVHILPPSPAPHRQKTNVILDGNVGPQSWQMDRGMSKCLFIYLSICRSHAAWRTQLICQRGSGRRDASQRSTVAFSHCLKSHSGNADRYWRGVTQLVIKNQLKKKKKCFGTLLKMHSC